MLQFTYNLFCIYLGAISAKLQNNPALEHPNKATVTHSNTTPSVLCSQVKNPRAMHRIAGGKNPEKERIL